MLNTIKIKNLHEIAQDNDTISLLFEDSAYFWTLNESPHGVAYAQGSDLEKALLSYLDDLATARKPIATNNTYTFNYNNELLPLETNNLDNLLQFFSSSYKRDIIAYLSDNSNSLMFHIGGSHPQTQADTLKELKDIYNIAITK